MQAAGADARTRTVVGWLSGGRPDGWTMRRRTWLSVAEAPFGGSKNYVCVSNCVSSPCIKSSLDHLADKEGDEECEVRVGRLLVLIMAKQNVIHTTVLIKIKTVRLFLSRFMVVRVGSM